MAGALAAFYNRVKVGHVEAGLRTGNRHSPFPEEANRFSPRGWRICTCADRRRATNLLAEGIAHTDAIVTGNTVVDALHHALSRQTTARPVSTEARRYALVTVHRRENHGDALQRICDAVLGLLHRQPDLDILLPMHPSPAVRKVIQQRLGAHARVKLTDALGYRAFVEALDGCTLALSDSGGLQEECAALGKPLLILRDRTERPEAVAAGVAVLVGTETRRIVDTALAVLTDRSLRQRMSHPSAEFGSGDAATRILDAVLEKASSATQRAPTPTPALSP